MIKHSISLIVLCIAVSSVQGSIFSTIFSKEYEQKHNIQNKERLQQKSPSPSPSPSPAAAPAATTTTTTTFTPLDSFGYYEQNTTTHIADTYITLGSYNVSAQVTINPDSPLTNFKVYNQTTNPFDSTFKRRYSPSESSQSLQKDNLRYQNTTYGTIGYYWQDTLCATYASKTKSYCWTQDFQGDIFYTDRYSPYDGALGLGIGSTFLLNLKSASKNTTAAQWSIVSGSYYTNQTQIIIGAPAYSFAAVDPAPSANKTSVYGLTWFNVSSGFANWTLDISNATFNQSQLVGANTVKAHFNVNTDYIQLPSSIYTSFRTALQKIIPTSSLQCGTSIYSGCYYTDVCSNLPVANFTGFTIQFGTNFTYNLPFNVFVDDGDNYYCYVRVIQRNDNLNFIEIGRPFFNGFTTTFDAENKRIGFAQTKYSLANITITPSV